MVRRTVAPLPLFVELILSFTQQKQIETT